MLMCKYCIQAFRSHGELLYYGMEIQNGTCDWCGEEDELFEVMLTDGKSERKSENAG